jgi:ABC-type polysaccharide/polyol phosphate export permease
MDNTSIQDTGVDASVQGRTSDVARALRPSSLRRNWDIVREFAVADFRLRYHDSLLGYLWFLLSPAMMFGVYYFVFTEVMFISIPNYALYLILGIVCYNFFQDCTFSAMYSLMAKAPIIKKIYFPRYLIIFASTVTGVFSLLVNLSIVLVVVLITEGVPPLLWLVPIPFICLVLFSTGVGLILAALYVKFRDLSQIWNVLALAIFWLTPVVYSVSLLPESTQIIMFINPLARIFMMFRHYLLYDLYDTQFLVLTVVSSLVMFAVGFLVFRRFQDTIAEQL